jgi:hypothetical protein
MRKQLASALLASASVGLLPDVHERSTHHQPLRFAAPKDHHRPFERLVARRAHFDQMKSAGRIKRYQLAAFCLEDGRLYAEWNGPLHIPQPMRIETEELDAEWMALAPATGSDLSADRAWLLARRDLAPQDDARFWFVRLYASHADPSRIDLLATTEFAHPSRRDAITIAYSQSAGAVRLQSSPAHRVALDLQAHDLRHLLHAYPDETDRYLIPALRRIANVDALPLT